MNGKSEFHGIAQRKPQLHVDSFEPAHIFGDVRRHGHYCRRQLRHLASVFINQGIYFAQQSMCPASLQEVGATPPVKSDGIVTEMETYTATDF